MTGLPASLGGTALLPGPGPSAGLAPAAFLAALITALLAAAAVAVSVRPALARARRPGWAAGRRPLLSGLTELSERPFAPALAAAGAVAVGTPVAGFAPALALALVVAAVVPGVRDAAIRRRALRSDLGWQAALRAIAAALQAGGTTPAALRRGAGSALAAGADSVRWTLTAAAAEAEMGGDAVPALGARCPDGVGRELVAALALAGELGAPPAQLAVRLADSVAARARAGRAATVALAGAQTTTRLLAGLPVAGLGLAAAFGASAPAYLLGTATGHACLLVGAAFEATGLTWTRRLLRAATVS